MLQRITVGVADQFCAGRCAADEVALPCRVAPGPLRIPMPGFDVQFGVLAVGHGLPAGGENLFDGVVHEEFVGGSVGETIDAGTQGFGWFDGVGGMTRGGVYVNGLGTESRYGESCGCEGED